MRETSAIIKERERTLNSKHVEDSPPQIMASVYKIVVEINPRYNLSTTKYSAKPPIYSRRNYM